LVKIHQPGLGGDIKIFNQIKQAYSSLKEDYKKSQNNSQKPLPQVNKSTQPSGKLYYFWSYYTIRGATHVKQFSNIFLEMTPVGVKTYGESEFDIFEAKKRFPDSRKTYVLKRKVSKLCVMPYFTFAFIF
jgi:hypothetical protein